MKFSLLVFLCIIFVIIVSVTVECNGIRWTSISKTKWTNRVVFEYHNIKYGTFQGDEGKFLPTIERRLNGNSVENNTFLNEYEKPLHLSIYTTNLEASHPVMVYIPGYDLVSRNHEKPSPGYLLEKDVILVSVKYRNGPLGFLSTLSNEIPGNAAIFDIISALKWIQQNIERFGGDPRRVTLFGQYKAAALIHVLALSELGKELFHQVIYQSGTALLQNFTTNDPLKYSREVGDILQCSNTIEKIELTKCLLESDQIDLKKAYKKVWTKYKRNIPFITIGGPSNVLNDTPNNIQKSGLIRIYPKILGFVDQPSAYFLDALDPNPNSLFTLDRYRNDAGKLIKLSTEAFGRTPLENKTLDVAYNELKNANETVLKSTFNLLVTSILDWSNFDMKTGIYFTGFLNKTPKTYAYAFKYPGQYHSLSRKEDNLLNEVTILDDNLYLFDRQDIELNADDTKIAKLMVEMWTSFAENGEPKAKNTVEWPEVKVGSDQYLSIDWEINAANDYTSEFQSAVKSFLEGAEGNLMTLPGSI